MHVSNLLMTIYSLYSAAHDYCRSFYDSEVEVPSQSSLFSWPGKYKSSTKYLLSESPHLARLFPSFDFRIWFSPKQAKHSYAYLKTESASLWH